MEYMVLIMYPAQGLGYNSTAVLFPREMLAYKATNEVENAFPA